MKFFILFTLVVLAIARPSSDELTAEEAQLAAELENAPFEEVDLTIEPIDDTTATRWFGVKQHIKENCACLHRNCGCCGKISAIGISLAGCMNITLYPELKVFEFSAHFGGLDLKRNLSVAHLQRSCKKLPFKLETCLQNDMTETEENGLQVCLSIDVGLFEKRVASLDIECIKYQNGELSFPEHPGTESQSMFKFKVKNPMKNAYEYLKRKFNGSPEVIENSNPTEGWEDVKPEQ